jgi:hypothetical protein
VRVLAGVEIDRFHAAHPLHRSTVQNYINIVGDHRVGSNTRAWYATGTSADAGSRTTAADSAATFWIA